MIAYEGLSFALCSKSNLKALEAQKEGLCNIRMPRQQAALGFSSRHELTSSYLCRTEAPRRLTSHRLPMHDGRTPS